MIKAAIFDLDGTLADSVESIAFAANKALEELGFQPLPVENYNFYAGDGADVLVQRALKAAGDTTLSKFEEADQIYKSFFEKDCTYKVSVFDGMKEVLDTLKSKGIKIAVLSNKPHLRSIQVVEYLFGEGYFDVIMGQQDHIPKKPDIAGAIQITKTFDVKPEECLYLGDTNVDMKTGLAAKMFTIGVLWGFRSKEELMSFHPNAVIETPEEILSYI